MSNDKNSTSTLQLNKGHMTFTGLGPKALTLSVGIGSMHYAGNRGADGGAPSSTMEIAVFSKEGDFLLENEVAGYVEVSLLPGLLMCLEKGNLKEVQRMLEDCVY